MELNHTLKIKQSDQIRVFATRIARQHFLRKFCDNDHPVLSIEYDLISMARSKLQEYILLNIPISHELKNILDKCVKDLAFEKTMALELEDDDKIEIIRSIMEENFDDLIPTIN